jgi:hypothetical protein
MEEPLIEVSVPLSTEERYTSSTFYRSHWRYHQEQKKWLPLTAVSVSFKAKAVHATVANNVAINWMHHLQ